MARLRGVNSIPDFAGANGGLPEILEIADISVDNAVSTTSNSFVVLADTPVDVVVPEGETWYIEYVAQLSFSHGTASSGAGNKAVFINNSQATQPQSMLRGDNFGSTGGRLWTLNSEFRGIFTEGTYDFDVRWSTDAGTIYSRHRDIQVFITKIKGS